MRQDETGSVRLSAKINRLIDDGELDTQVCSHLALIQDVVPSSADGCTKCLEMGDTWVNLRLCTTCGHVGCCDNSKNKHATAHFHETKHPVIVSFEPEEKWIWCYVDEILVDPE